MPSVHPCPETSGFDRRYRTHGIARPLVDLVRRLSAGLPGTVLRLALVSLTMTAALAPAQQADIPTLEEWRKRFPVLAFQDNFYDTPSGQYPKQWETLLVLMHPHAEVRDGVFKIRTGQNIHVLRDIEADDFLLSLDVRGYHLDPNKDFCFMPCFRITGDHDRRGYFIFHQFGRHGPIKARRGYVLGEVSLRTTLHDLTGGVGTAWSVPNTSAFYALPHAVQNEQAGHDLFDNRVFHTIVVIAWRNRFLLYHDGFLMGDFLDTEHRFQHGRIGVSMAGSGLAQPGPMYIRRVRLYRPHPQTHHDSSP